MKFGRIFSLYVEGRDGKHTMTSPLTCRFKVSNNCLFTSGSATIQIYNLTQDTRSDLYKDAYEIAIYKKVILAAGYENEPSVPIIFQGNVLKAFSYRQGPDWITEIQGLDGGFAIDNSSINLTKPSPYDVEDLLTDTVKSMQPTLNLGVIGSFNFPNSRGITFSGNPWDLITRLMCPLLGQAYIDREVVNIVRQWEYIQDEGQLDIISADTGMIGTPRLQDAIVKVRMIFEPRLSVGQKIELQTIESRMSGDYKVVSVDHQGTISGAVCEDLTTETTIFQPQRALEQVV